MNFWADKLLRYTKAKAIQLLTASTICQTHQKIANKITLGLYKGRQVSNLLEEKKLRHLMVDSSKIVYKYSQSWGSHFFNSYGHSICIVFFFLRLWMKAFHLLIQSQGSPRGHAAMPLLSACCSQPWRKHGRHSWHSYTDIPVIYEDSDFDNESKTTFKKEYALIWVMMETDFAERSG